MDDLRQSPALEIVQALSASENRVLAFDPYISNNKLSSLTSLPEVLESSDLLVFLVAHSEFLEIDCSNHCVMDFTGAFSQSI